MPTAGASWSVVTRTPHTLLFSTSRSCIVTYEVSSSLTARFWPVPSMMGSAPVPYAPIVIGLALVPDEEKTNDPLHVVPRLNSRLSPGPKALPLTAPRLFHGAPDEPSPGMAAAQFT